ncbi:MAG TPA: Na/Pi cotransporter family protein, partial [Rhizobiales bacterium]|nr:Na/Pi cotransporter family protein [Hyphomicrobiales bacterium]
MDIMTQALKRAAGEHLKSLLATLTRNRFSGVLTGAFVTSVIQSSSVTTVILVGFISAGLLSMGQSVAVIMGANIGTTITAQILAFKVTKLALPILAAGFLVSAVAKRENWRQYGLMALGLGLIFYGMGVMSSAVGPLRSYEPFIRFMTTMQNPLLAAFAGAAFTAVIQSSSATTGILIAMAGQGLIGLEAAIAITLGANIGTCITAVLAAIGKPREAMRAAAVHTLFNVAGVLLWIGFVPQLAELARAISPVHENLSATARLAAETPRQIANVHTFFNVANTFIFIGFTTQIARFVNWLIPDKPLKEAEEMAPKYLDESLLLTPSIALVGARREAVRLGRLVRDMLDEVVPAAIARDAGALDGIAAKDKII